MSYGYHDLFLYGPFLDTITSFFFSGFRFGYLESP